LRIEAARINDGVRRRRSSSSIASIKCTVVGVELLMLHFHPTMDGLRTSID